MLRLSPAVVVLSLIAIVAAPSVEAAQRAFVASYGSDSNTASGCGLATPCRTFAAALTVVDNGGEVIALDGAGYGPITITKSVTITANPGFYAGIAATTASNAYAVTIATAGVNVTLRGLTINNNGGFHGVVMTNGANLSIENCIISNFATGNGVDVRTAATVRIIDSIIRDNYWGVYLDGGAMAGISGTKILGNSNGVMVRGGVDNTTTTAAVSDSNVSGNGVGVYAQAVAANAVARVSFIRSTISNNGWGIYVTDYIVGTQVITVSDSMVTGNNYGLYQAGTSTLESLGNNTVRQNGTNTSGTITTVSPM
jgi:Periplasmic copper-binding protein (NosD)